MGSPRAKFLGEAGEFGGRRRSSAVLFNILKSSSDALDGLPVQVGIRFSRGNSINRSENNSCEQKMCLYNSRSPRMFIKTPRQCFRIRSTPFQLNKPTYIPRHQPRIPSYHFVLRGMKVVKLSQGGWDPALANEDMSCGLRPQYIFCSHIRTQDIYYARRTCAAAANRIMRPLNMS